MSLQITRMPEPTSSPESRASDFNPEAFKRAYSKALPAELLNHDGAAMRHEIIAQFPAELVAWLLRDIAPQTLWPLLKNRGMVGYFHGFQAVPKMIRQSAVQKRLLQHFEKNLDDLHALLLLWATQKPAPPGVEAVQASEDAALEFQLPILAQKFGAQALGAALAFGARVEAFGKWNALPDAPASPIEIPTEATEARMWKERAQELQKALETLERKVDLSARREAQNRSAAQLSETQILLAKEKQAAAGAQKKFEAMLQKSQAERLELQKHLERAERRLRALERERKDGEELLRTVQKQLRHNAVLLEEERQKRARLETAPKPPTPGTAPVPVSPKPQAPQRKVAPTPLDEVFEWVADGRAVRVCARETVRLINRNDEDATWQIMLALESLEASDKAKRFAFLGRVRSAGEYYVRVLTASTTRVLVDASNVARSLPNRYGKGQLVHLLRLREELRRHGAWPLIFIADASLPYNIDQPQKLREMARAGEIQLTDKGVEADEILAREARRTGAYVVSLDTRFWHKTTPDFEPPRVPFRVLEDAVFVDDF